MHSSILFLTILITSQFNLHNALAYPIESDCSKLLLYSPKVVTAFPSTWEFHNFTSNTVLGHTDLSRKSIMNLYENSLRRRAPVEANKVLELIWQQRPLSKIETRIFLESVGAEYRQQFHSELQATHFPLGRHFIFAAEKEMLRNDRNSRAWKTLGFSVRGDQSTSPTYAELGERLALLQSIENVSPGLRLKLSEVFKNFSDTSLSYHAIDLPISSGVDVPAPNPIVSFTEFFDAIERGYMMVGNSTHDIAHVIVWTLHPDLLEKIKRLAASYKVNPLDDSLRFRIIWASESLSLPTESRIARHRNKIWAFRLTTSLEQLSPDDSFKSIVSLINSKTYAEVLRHAKEDLLPIYRSLYEPFGGANVQYGEMSQAWTDEYRLSPRYFDVAAKEMGSTRDGKNYAYSDLDILYEQPENLADEIHFVEDYLQLSADERKSRMINLVARMEFSIIEMSKFDANEILDLFGADWETRRKSRFTQIIKILRGTHSSIYRVLQDK